LEGVVLRSDSVVPLAVELIRFDHNASQFDITILIAAA
jgi:hypothetical protein